MNFMLTRKMLLRLFLCLFKKNLPSEKNCFVFLLMKYNKLRKCHSSVGLILDGLQFKSRWERKVLSTLSFFGVRIAIFWPSPSSQLGKFVAWIPYLLMVLCILGCLIHGSMIDQTKRRTCASFFPPFKNKKCWLPKEMKGKWNSYN